MNMSSAEEKRQARLEAARKRARERGRFAELCRLAEGRMLRQQSADEEREERRKATQQAIEQARAEVERDILVREAEQDATYLMQRSSALAVMDWQVEAKAEWNAYLECRPLPDPADKAALNNFRTHFQAEGVGGLEDDEAAPKAMLPSCIQKCARVEEVVQRMEGEMGRALEGGDVQKLLWTSNYITSVRTLARRKMDLLTSRFLQRAGEYENRDNVMEVSVQEGQVRYALWVHTTAKGSLVQSIDFAGINVHIGIPTTLQKARTSIRVIHSAFDPVSTLGYTSAQQDSPEQSGESKGEAADSWYENNGIGIDLEAAVQADLSSKIIARGGKLRGVEGEQGPSLLEKAGFGAPEELLNSGDSEEQKSTDQPGSPQSPKSPADMLSGKSSEVDIARHVLMDVTRIMSLCPVSNAKIPIPEELIDEQANGHDSTEVKAPSISELGSSGSAVASNSEPPVDPKDPFGLNNKVVLSRPPRKTDIEMYEEGALREWLQDHVHGMTRGLPTDNPRADTKLWYEFDRLHCLSDQARFVSVGGVIIIEQLQLPAPTKHIKSCRIRELSPLSYALQSIPYPSVQEMKSAQSLSPFRIRYGIPKDIFLTPEQYKRPMMGLWDPERRDWVLDGIRVKDETDENGVVGIDLSKLAPFAIVQPRALDFPYRAWTLQAVNLHTCHLSLTGSRLTVKLELRTGNRCRVLEPQHPGLKALGLLDNYMPPGKLLLRLQKAGINILPADSDARFCRKPLKEKSFERWLHLQAASVCSMVTIRGCRYNSGLGPDRAMVWVSMNDTSVPLEQSVRVCLTKELTKYKSKVLEEVKQKKSLESGAEINAGADDGLLATGSAEPLNDNAEAVIPVDPISELSPELTSAERKCMDDMVVFGAAQYRRACVLFDGTDPEECSAVLQQDLDRTQNAFCGEGSAFDVAVLSTMRKTGAFGGDILGEDQETYLANQLQKATLGKSDLGGFVGDDGQAVISTMFPENENGEGGESALNVTGEFVDDAAAYSTEQSDVIRALNPSLSVNEIESGVETGTLRNSTTLKTEDAHSWGNATDTDDSKDNDSENTLVSDRSHYVLTLGEQKIVAEEQLPLSDFRTVVGVANPLLSQVPDNNTDESPAGDQPAGDEDLSPHGHSKSRSRAVSWAALSVDGWNDGEKPDLSVTPGDDEVDVPLTGLAKVRAEEMARINLMHKSKRLGGALKQFVVEEEEDGGSEEDPAFDPLFSPTSANHDENQGEKRKVQVSKITTLAPVDPWLVESKIVSEQVGMMVKRREELSSHLQSVDALSSLSVLPGLGGCLARKIFPASGSERGLHSQVLAAALRCAVLGVDHQPTSLEEWSKYEEKKEVKKPTSSSRQRSRASRRSAMRSRMRGRSEAASEHTRTSTVPVLPPDRAALLETWTRSNSREHMWIPAFFSREKVYLCNSTRAEFSEDSVYADSEKFLYTHVSLRRALRQHFDPILRNHRRHIVDNVQSVLDVRSVSLSGGDNAEDDTIASANGTFDDDLDVDTKGSGPDMDALRMEAANAGLSLEELMEASGTSFGQNQEEDVQEVVLDPATSSDVDPASFLAARPFSAMLRMNDLYTLSLQQTVLSVLNLVRPFTFF